MGLKKDGGVTMCARRVGSRISAKAKERKSIQELMMQARLLE